MAVVQKLKEGNEGHSEAVMGHNASCHKKCTGQERGKENLKGLNLSSWKNDGNTTKLGRYKGDTNLGIRCIYL